MEERQYRSDAFAAIHETMEALQDIGALNKTTMEEFDEMCLEPIPIPREGVQESYRKDSNF